MFNKFSKLIATSLMCLQFTAYPSIGLAAEAGPPGKDGTVIADGTMELSKLKVSATDNGKYLAAENGTVVPKAIPSSDASGTFLYKNAAGDVVAKSPLGVSQVVTNKGHVLSNITSPQYLSAYGVLESGMANVYLVFAGAGCTGEARFVRGDSSMAASGTIIGGFKSISSGPANEVFYEVDAASGVQTDTFVAMSHSNNFACAETTVGGTTYTRSLKGVLYLTNPITELGFVSAETKP